MLPIDVRVFIQARMNSSRYPGKVLAPLFGRPVVDHVTDACAEVVGKENVVVLTSTEVSDDPLWSYMTHRGISVFRGDLDDVFERFLAALEPYPCTWMVRICADSPVIDNGIIRAALAAAADGDYDIVTNTFPRSFPRGQSVEVVRTKIFRAIDPSTLDAAEREHVTKVFYNRADAYTILNLVAEAPTNMEPGLSLDTFEDYRYLASLTEIPRFPVAGKKK